MSKKNKQKKNTKRGSMYHGWRDCFASRLWQVQFLCAPQKTRSSSRITANYAALPTRRRGFDYLLLHTNGLGTYALNRSNTQALPAGP